MVLAHATAVASTRGWLTPLEIGRNDSIDYVWLSEHELLRSRATTRLISPSLGDVPGNLAEWSTSAVRLDIATKSERPEPRWDKQSGHLSNGLVSPDGRWLLWTGGSKDWQIDEINGTRSLRRRGLDFVNPAWLPDSSGWLTLSGNTDGKGSMSVWRLNRIAVATMSANLPEDKVPGTLESGYNPRRVGELLGVTSSSHAISIDGEMLFTPRCNAFYVGESHDPGDDPSGAKWQGLKFVEWSTGPHASLLRRRRMQFPVPPAASEWPKPSLTSTDVDGYISMSPTGDRVLWYVSAVDLGTDSSPIMSHIRQWLRLPPPSNRNRQFGIWTSGTDGRDLKLLGLFPRESEMDANTEAAIPRWMPDGKHISFVRNNTLWKVAAP